MGASHGPRSHHVHCLGDHGDGGVHRCLVATCTMNKRNKFYILFGEMLSYRRSIMGGVHSGAGLSGSGVGAGTDVGPPRTTVVVGASVPISRPVTHIEPKTVSVPTREIPRKAAGGPKPIGVRRDEASAKGILHDMTREFMDRLDELATNGGVTNDSTRYLARFRSGLGRTYDTERFQAEDMSGAIATIAQAMLNILHKQDPNRWPRTSIRIGMDELFAAISKTDGDFLEMASDIATHFERYIAQRLAGQTDERLKQTILTEMQALGQTIDVELSNRAIDRPIEDVSSRHSFADRFVRFFTIFIEKYEEDRRRWSDSFHEAYESIERYIEDYKRHKIGYGRIIMQRFHEVFDALQNEGIVNHHLDADSFREKMAAFGNMVIQFTELDYDSRETAKEQFLTTLHDLTNKIIIYVNVSRQRDDRDQLLAYAAMLGELLDKAFGKHYDEMVIGSGRGKSVTRSMDLPDKFRELIALFLDRYDEIDGSGRAIETESISNGFDDINEAWPNQTDALRGAVWQISGALVSAITDPIDMERNNRKIRDAFKALCAATSSAYNVTRETVPSLHADLIGTCQHIGSELINYMNNHREGGYVSTVARDNIVQSARALGSLLENLVLGRYNV